jgi:hypothetical protein
MIGQKDVEARPMRPIPTLLEVRFIGRAKFCLGICRSQLRVERREIIRYSSDIHLHERDLTSQ